MTRPATTSTHGPDPAAPPPSLQEVEDRFIENWGDISSLWGVNRTIGRIHALLFISSAALSMEHIAQRLQISHGNASTSLRDLLAWSVIRKIHIAGERRTFYEAEKDPWTWFHTCIRERRRREIMPVMDQIARVREEAKEKTAKAPKDQREEFEHARARIEEFGKFMEEFVALIDAFLAMGHGPLGKTMLGVAKMLPSSKGTKHKD